jgi:hypothetical protein
VSARFVFLAGAVVAAIVFAMLAGFIIAVAGLSAEMPTAALVTLTAETAAAVFSGVIALSGTAATLFFNTPEPGALPAALGHLDAVGWTRLGGIDGCHDYTIGDRKLCAALRARAELGRELRAWKSQQ